MARYLTFGSLLTVGILNCARVPAQRFEVDALRDLETERRGWRDLEEPMVKTMSVEDEQSTDK
jgi:hypothetical protein